VWSGVEYQVAAHLIYDGLVAHGLEIATAVRRRHDGYRRNPWDEVECGHHYARAMASWAVLLALAGFQCDVERRVLRFEPAMNQRSFRTVFTCGAGWGIYRQMEDAAGRVHPALEVLGGHLEGFVLEVGDRRWTIVGGGLADERHPPDAQPDRPPATHGILKEGMTDE